MENKIPAYRKGVAIGRAFLVLTIVLIALKCTNAAINMRVGTYSLVTDVSAWPWWIVLAPTWVPAVCVLVIMFWIFIIVLTRKNKSI